MLPLPRPILLSLLLSAAAILLALLASASAVEQAQLAARWTARAGYPLFLVTYAASSLVRLWPSGWSRTLVRARRHWGLAFALTHTVHLVAILCFFQLSGDSPPLRSVVGGGLGYILLYAMAATSNWNSVRRLGHGWKILHRTGIHYFWLIFAISYAGRLSRDGQMLTGAIGLALAFGALGLRVAAFLKSRRSRVA